MSRELARIIRRAANNRLSLSPNSQELTDSWESYSCCVIAEELTDSESSCLYDIYTNRFGGFTAKQERQATRLRGILYAAGVEMGTTHAFDDIPENDRQAVRYAWMHFIADRVEAKEI